MLGEVVSHYLLGSLKYETSVSKAFAFLSGSLCSALSYQHQVKDWQ